MQFIEKTRGSNGYPGGGHPHGGGGGSGGFAAASGVGRRFASFVSDVAQNGLPHALEQIGLGDFKDRPAYEILHALVDRLGGPSSTIYEVDAKMALSRLQEKILEGAADAEAVEKILQERAKDLENILRQFFCFYLYEHFCRVFFERLEQKIGNYKAETYLSQIKSFIEACVDYEAVQNDLSKIDWSGQEGAEVTNQMMERTLAVFGG